MLKFVVKAVRALLAAVLVCTNLLTPLTGDRRGKIEDAAENCNASFVALSDTHIKDNFIRQGMLELGLADIEEAKDRPDALVFCGDITDHGYIDMWDCFARAMGKYDMTDNTILVEGNHDTWGPDRDDLSTVKQTFIDYNKKVSGRDVSEMYYTTTIGKYPAIILGSEGDSTSATVSDTQLEWFTAEMEKASATGLPIFVFFHQPINQTHGLPLSWEMDKDDLEKPAEGGIGDASEAVLNIIKQYKNVFYISGHIHAGFSTEDDGTIYSSVEQHDGYTLVNLPCFMYPDVKRGGNITNGTGYLFEIYDEQVMIRARNFATGTWCTKYDVTIGLTK